MTYFLLALWGPTHALRTPLGILLLGGLAAAGVYTLHRQTLLEFPDAVHADGPGLMTAPRGAVEPAAAPPTHATTGAPSAAEEIERLHALRTARAISEEEFQRGKERALS